MQNTFYENKKQKTLFSNQSQLQCIKYIYPNIDLDQNFIEKFIILNNSIKLI